MKALQLVMIMGLLTMPLLGQPREGRNKELSLSGSYQNYSTDDGPRNVDAVLLSPRLGFFVVEGPELEPEALFMFTSGADPVYVLNGNVSYNLLSEGAAVPFLLVGYGIANTVPFLNVPRALLDFRVDVLNAGAGLKAYLQEDIAVRIEYRFQRFSGDGETTHYGPFASTQEVHTRIHSVQFGFSVLL